MGTDIHGWIRNKADDTLIADIDDHPPLGDRNYRVFTALSGVRGVNDGGPSLQQVVTGKEYCDQEVPESKLLIQPFEGAAYKETIAEYMAGGCHSVTVFTLADLLAYYERSKGFNVTRGDVTQTENVADQIKHWVDKAVSVCEGIEPDDAQFIIGYDS